ncbi:MAG: intrarane metalloprotease [Holophagaceae bacterium]|nr:intrarane metalloprotease [Holophagaceae bacterium]
MNPEADQSSFPNLWQGTGVALAYLALSTWLDTAMAVAAHTLHLPGWTALLPGLLLGFPLALAFGIWLGRLDLWDILSFRRVRPGIWLPLLVTHLGFFILIQAFAHGLEFGLDQLPEAFRLSLVKESEPMAQASAPMLGLLFASAAIPEEILFRGFILRGLLGHHRPLVAVWLSTALFVVAHGNPLHNLFIGLFMTPEVLATGSLMVNPLPPLPWLLAAPFLAGLGLLWLRWQFRQEAPAPMGVLGLDQS